MTEQTCYRWRREYGGLKLDQAKRLRELEKENAGLKKLLAESELDKAMLKETAPENFRARLPRPGVLAPSDLLAQVVDAQVARHREEPVVAACDLEQPLRMTRHPPEHLLHDVPSDGVVPEIVRDEPDERLLVAAQKCAQPIHLA